MDRLTDVVLRHRRWVFAFWGVMLVAGVGLAGVATNRLTFDFSLPGQPGWETDAQIQRTFGNGGGNTPYIPVVTVPAGSTVEERKAEIAAVFAAVQEQLPETRVVDYATTGDKTFVTEDGRSTYALVYPPTATSFELVTEPKLRKALEAEAGKAGLSTGITSYDLLSAGDSSGEGPSVLFETLIGAFGALLVLVFVFASFLALVPLAIAAVSILSTFITVLLLTTVTDVSFVVQFLISLVGLGVAIDYSLLLVSRWCEERAHGRDNHNAVREAVRTAGHAVIASGVTVAISLLALVAVPVPFLRSMGLGGMLIPLVSTAVVLTLLPAILGGIGPRVDWPRVRRENTASRAWTAWARGIVRFRVLAAVVALAVLGLLILPLAGIKIGLSNTESLAKSGPAYETLQTLERGGVPTGVLTPVEILVKGGDPDAVADKARGVDGVATAFAPDAAQWRKDGSALVDAIPRDETVDQDGAAIVQRIDDALAGEQGIVGEAGTGAVVVDYINAVFKKFPLALSIIALVTYVLLVRTFRSVLLPLKAVLLNCVSVAATFGGTVWFWQEGHGSEAIFGVSATGAVTFWLPILIFAFLFGLSMDYEVFILARMREEYDRGGTTRAAIVEGLGRTGRLVTSAALILFLSFLALAGTPGTDIRVFATALGFGILLDATIVRALLVPSLVALFGSWNWYLPDWVARVLRIETSHAHAEVPSPRGELADEPVGSRRT